MSSLYINSLYIFEYKNKLAKKVDFSKGINVITSNKIKGNDVGKSILMKSIYHTLGADSIFDDKWESESKTYLIDINIDEEKYYIYRSGNLFKGYTENFIKIFSTTNREELAENLSKLYNFRVLLPNRQYEELEISPPVYSYLLNYVDQDHLNGPKFNSFKSLGQYSDYKEKVIFNHFGIFDEKYFNAVKSLEKLKKDKKNNEDDKLIVDNMLSRVRKYLNGMDAPTDMITLNIQLEDKRKEYYDIVVNLKKIKNNLIKIRNEKSELEINLSEIKDLETVEYRRLINKEQIICSNCKHIIEDLNSKIRLSSQLEDLIIIKDDLEKLLLEVDRKINKEELKYKALLDRLKEFDEAMNISTDGVSNVLRHRGYIETQENILKELNEIEAKLIDIQNNIDICNKTISKYNKSKKIANKLYEKYMIEAKDEFGLEEINNNRFKEIKLNFEARGSNKPISTIIWYFNLIKVKDELNKNAIKFPLVLDSPNNGELDDNKKTALFKYIFTNSISDTQLIVSTLGFNELDYEGIKIDNVIKLKNEKYHILNNEDFEENKDILKILLEK